MTLTTILLLGLVAADDSRSVAARFIGNSAFELSDGETTLLVDFPYRSGAFGYMTFPPGELRARERSTCLFTHRHDDHFDPGAIETIGCTVAGPADVQASVPERLRAGSGPTWRAGAAAIRCMETPHSTVGHCSYFISWHGVEIFISGDVESVDDSIVLSPEIDVLFLPSWLMPAVARLDRPPVAGRVVVHHHKPGETPPTCSECVVLEPGSTISLGS